MSNSHRLGAPAINQGIPLGHDGDDFLLFHWAPSTRRKSISRLGLVPGKISTDKVWKPPFICFSTSPSLAWSLSGMRQDYNNAHASWDLWMTWAGTIGGAEMIPFDDGTPKEYRVYRRILKSEIWFIGSRTALGDKGPL